MKVGWNKGDGAKRKSAGGFHPGDVELIESMPKESNNEQVISCLYTELLITKTNRKSYVYKEQSSCVYT